MKRSARVLTLAATVAMMSSVAAGCSSAANAPDATTSGPIKVGVALPLSGPLAPSAATYKVVFSNIGKGLPNTDTIDGRKVEIVLRDSLGTAAGGAATVRQLLDQDNVDVVIGPLFTAAGEASMPLTTQAKKLQVLLTGCATCGDPAKYPYSFSVEADRPSQMPSTVKAMKAAGLSKVGLLVSNDGGGTSYADNFTAEAKNEGLSIVKTVSFAPNALDMGAQISQLKASGADAVYLASAVPLDVKTATKAMSQASYQPAVYGNAALKTTDVTNGVDPTWLKTWASSGSGEYVSQPDPPQKTVAFRDAINKVQGTTELPLALNEYTSAMDAFGVVKAAVEGTHTTDAGAMTKWLVKNGYDGVKAKFTFTDAKHNGLTADAQVLVQPGTLSNGFLTRVGAGK